MKKIWLLSLVLYVAAALPVRGASTYTANKWKDEFTKHWQTTKEFTLDVANAMPAENYSFKPNPEEMSFGALMIHIATANANNFATVGGTKSSLKPPDPNDKDAVIKYLTDSFDFCSKVLADLTDDQLDAMTGPSGRHLTGRERLWSYFTHTAHHRGQAEVYMRVKNLKPPAYRF